MPRSGNPCPFPALSCPPLSSPAQTPHLHNVTISSPSRRLAYPAWSPCLLQVPQGEVASANPLDVQYFVPRTPGCSLLPAYLGIYSPVAVAWNRERRKDYISLRPFNASGRIGSHARLASSSQDYDGGPLR